MLPRDPTTPLLFDEAVPELPPLQQLLDKTEYLNQQSGGIHVLLDGTKEELWPVYGMSPLCIAISIEVNIIMFLICVKLFFE